MDEIEFLVEENRSLRKSGFRMARAAMRVAEESDGVHRLLLSVSEWATAVAGEGGRRERFKGKERVMRGEIVRHAIIREVLEERRRQEEKWGEQNHSPDGWALIIQEEQGEVAKAILEGRGLDYRGEMIQVAAVAISAIESFDRGNVIGDSLVNLQLKLKGLEEGK